MVKREVISGIRIVPYQVQVAKHSKYSPHVGVCNNIASMRFRVAISSSSNEVTLGGLPDQCVSNSQVSALVSRIAH